MRAIADPHDALGRGLAAIRAQYQIPLAFPGKVLAAAEAAAKRAPTRRADRTGLKFVTLDPASSTDLDQAFTIERSGPDLLLRYAIADVSWFVDDGDPIDEEAWRRGETLYLPDGKAGLYPPILSEGAASLLPDGPRPAIVFIVRVAGDGRVQLDGAERAVIRSRAKLAYENARDSDLPADFAELANRIEAAEQSRGAARVDPPDQEMVAAGEGRFELLFRPPLLSERRNACLSLATNLAVAEALQAHGTGLFRVMAEPDKWAVRRLRHTAAGLGIDWPTGRTLAALERRLDPANPNHATFMLAVQRASQGASYLPYRKQAVPWHAAVAATYAHATAPLRRLADRYVVGAALAVANGRGVPGAIAQAFDKLPAVMGRADALAGQVDRAVIDLAEAVLLRPREGQSFEAVATEVDRRGARIQLCGFPVVARVAADGIEAGARLTVKLVAADPDSRTVSFERVDG